MAININQYRPNSIFVLSNDYYIDINETSNGEVTLQVKSPEGAVFSEAEPVDNSVAYNPLSLKPYVDTTIVNIVNELGVESLEVIEIIQKQIPPIEDKNSTIKVFGRVVNNQNIPISNAQLTPVFLSFPPPFPSPQSPESGEYTDFENTTFKIGAPIIVAPTSSNEDGLFEFIFDQSEEIDFAQSYIMVSKDEYFPKQVGPKFLKTGEEVLVKTNTISTTQVSAFVVSEEINVIGGVINATVTLENSSTGEQATGVGKSGVERVALGIAEENARKQFIEIAEEEITINIDLYDLGKIQLLSNQISIESLRSLEIQALKQIDTTEVEIIVDTLKSDLPLETRAQLIFSTKKEELKRRAIPYALTLLARFGPNIVNSILGGIKDPLSDAVCLPKEKLQEILNKRNELTRTINNAYKVIRTLSKILNVSRAFIAGLQAGLLIAQALSAVPPGRFGWSGAMEKGFKEVDKILKRASIAVNGLSILSATTGAVLAFILQLLALLDFLLQSCSEEINSDGEFTLSFVEINDELNSFTDPTTGQTEDIIDPLTGDPLPYKGFTFEIKQDISQNFQYPKRFAIARNIQGIQVLKSESSFASNPEILIQELKFVIDRDNLRAD